MKPFNVRILASDHPFYEGECLSLSLPCIDGMLGILADHSNMISAMVPGIMKYKIPGDEEFYAAVSRGIVKVENGEVHVLADTIERPEEIDENRSRKREEAAKEAMLQKRSIREYKEAQATYARAANRLRLKNLRNI